MASAQKKLKERTELREKQKIGKYGEAENNWFKVPDIYTAACARRAFQGRAEEQIVMLIMMEEWGGFGGPMRKGAPLSLPEIASRIPSTGAPSVREGEENSVKCLDQKTVSNAIARLLKTGILEKIETRGNVNCYHVNLRTMHAAAPYVYEPPKLELVPKPAPALEAQRLIPPQKAATFQYIDALDSVERIVEAFNQAKIPLAVACTMVNGKLRIDIWLQEDAPAPFKPANPARSEQKAKRGGSPVPVLERTVLIKTPISIGSPHSQLPITHSKLDYGQILAAACDPIRAARWPLEHFSGPFLARIAAALGETPVENFVALACADLAKAKNLNRDGSTKKDSQILIAYARQARENSERDAPARDRAAAQLSRLIAATGCTEDQARDQIARWQKSHWDVEQAIRRNEQSAKGGGA